MLDRPRKAELYFAFISFFLNYQYTFDIHLFNTHAKHTSYSLTSKKPKYFLHVFQKGTKIVEDANKRSIKSIFGGFHNSQRKNLIPCTQVSFNRH